MGRSHTEADKEAISKKSIKYNFKGILKISDQNYWTIFEISRKYGQNKASYSQILVNLQDCRLIFTIIFCSVGAVSHFQIVIASDSYAEAPAGFRFGGETF